RQAGERVKHPGADPAQRAAADVEPAAQELEPGAESLRDHVVDRTRGDRVGQKRRGAELAPAPPVRNVLGSGEPAVSQRTRRAAANSRRASRAAPRRSSLRLPLSLPGSFASLTMITRTDS